MKNTFRNFLIIKQFCAAFFTGCNVWLQCLDNFPRVRHACLSACLLVNTTAIVIFCEDSYPSKGIHDRVPRTAVVCFTVFFSNGESIGCIFCVPLILVPVVSLFEKDVYFLSSNAWEIAKGVLIGLLCIIWNFLPLNCLTVADARHTNSIKGWS